LFLGVLFFFVPSDSDVILTSARFHAGIPQKKGRKKKTMEYAVEIIYWDMEPVICFERILFDPPQKYRKKSSNT